MKAIRRPLFWFNLAMWLVSIVISTLLINLGSLIMSDVPTAARLIDRDDFVDSARLEATDARIDLIETALAQNANAVEDAQFVLRSRTLDYQNQRANFENWVSSRRATGEDSQNAEVVARVNAIEALKLAEREAERTVETLQQDAVQARRTLAELYEARGQIVEDATAPFERARSLEVLKVFGLRLALTLPLLLIAGWLVMKKRGSTYWPVYRGFVIFALFAFFVELVPYLPSYGGYVRYVVGIVLALLVAHFAIRGMARYLQNKRAEEDKPDSEKRKLIGYETAVTKISDGVCPSCDRQFAAKAPRKGQTIPDSKVDFCVHCGFCLFSYCKACEARENSFYNFCGSCGTPSEGAPTPSAT